MKQKIALISVYNKEGIDIFSKNLVDLGWKIVSSGGTAKFLTERGIPNTDVAEITGMPAILSHRVATLHPKIHGGLLALNTPEHLAEMEKYEISWLDLVCVDFYPLEDEIKKEGSTKESVIEKTDIGGPTMVRAGAKGDRITICDKKDREKVIAWLKAGEPARESFLNDLRAKAEIIIAKYCATSGEYHSTGKYSAIFGEKVIECSYGENAYQARASMYKTLGENTDPLSLEKWALVAGSPMSYNNICDLDRMIQTMTHIGAGFEKNFNAVPDTAIGTKHGNSCGAGVGPLGPRGPTPGAEAVDKMLRGDLRAIFGGSVMLNFPVDEKIAEDLINKFSSNTRRLLDIVAAPSFTTEAIEILSRKKGKCRLLENKNILHAGLASLDTEKRFRYVRGGFLEQPNYTFVPDFSTARLSLAVEDLVLAWAVGCTSNSNTITLVKEGRLVGNGVGQQDRVGSAKLAIFRADDAANFAKNSEVGPQGSRVPTSEFKADLNNAVTYSDSFFPFSDAPEVLIDRGIKTIFSTSGSVNDEKIIKLCEEKGVKLILMPDKEARGFYQH